MSAVDAPARPRITLPIPSWLRPGGEPEPAPKALSKSRHGVRAVGESARVAVWLLTAVSLLAGWAVAYAVGVSALQEQRSQRTLYATLREHLALGTVPISGTIKEGTPIALLQLPLAGVHKLVVSEGTTSGDLRAGPGHRPDTALPGQPGWSFLFGRSTTFGGPFRSIAHLRVNDPIGVTTGQGTYHFRVDRIRHPGETVPGIEVGASRLTLVTAAGSGWRSGWAPNNMVYVDATLTDKATAPATNVNTATKSEAPMHADLSALVPLVLWLQALAIAAIAVGWVRLRWGGWQTWLAGVPIVFAALWGATDAASQLLPNLF